MTRVDFAGKTVTLPNGLHDPSVTVPAGSAYQVEGYWDEITGGSWMNANGNYACMNYAIRSAHAGLPLDNEVLYGKVEGLGFLVHVSEVAE